MKIVLFFALVLFAAAPAQATDFDDFFKRVQKVESVWQKSKLLCVCTDGGALDDTVGTLQLTLRITSAKRVAVECLVPGFDASTGAQSTVGTCALFEVLGK